MIIGLGGFIGAILRYGISGWAYQLLGARLPYGTLMVNILGSFMLGFFMALINTRILVPDATRNFIAIGLLGALTTFSTFSYETVALLQSNLLLKAGLNIIFNVLFTLIAVWLGMVLAKII